jgi:hypothetical protein
LHLGQPFAALFIGLSSNLIHEIVAEVSGAVACASEAEGLTGRAETKVHGHRCVSFAGRPRTNAPGFSIRRRTASRARSLALNPLSRASSLSARRRSADNRNSNRVSFSIVRNPAVSFTAAQRTDSFAWLNLAMSVEGWGRPRLRANR